MIVPVTVSNAKQVSGGVAALAVSGLVRRVWVVRNRPPRVRKVGRVSFRLVSRPRDIRIFTVFPFL